MTSKSKLNISAVNQRFLEKKAKKKLALKTQTFSVFYIAALVYEFDLPFIRSQAKTIFNHVISKDEEEQLLLESKLLRFSQKYILSENKRKETLLELDQKGKLLSFFEKITAYINDPTTEFVGKCLKGKPIDLDQLDLPQLHTLKNIVDSLEATSFKDKLPEQSIIKSLVNQKRMIAYFKQQVESFAGRKEELERLEKYVNPFRQNLEVNNQKNPLLIYGIGGIGKSTLIAKYISDLWERKDSSKIPFVYIDFDKINLRKEENTSFNPLTLADEAFRQLSIQFPTIYPLLDIRRAIQDYLENPNSLDQGVKKSRGTTSSFTRQTLYNYIFSRFLNFEDKEQYDNLNRSILVVLDSFEEFQNSANSTEFYELTTFIEEVRELAPKMALVIAGRTDYFSTTFLYEDFELKGFDREACLGYLEGKGVTNVDQQIKIAEKSNGIPLALNLLANLVLKKEKELEGQKNSNFNWNEFYEKMDQERLTEQLVIRNIEHISEEVRELGIPGIIIRKITPEIIKDVLAKPCGLGVINNEKATELFQQLKKEVFLLEEFKDELYFRRDLRECIQDLIKKKYQNIVDQIHESALKYYKGKPNASDRAEYLYHLLMKGGGVKAIEKYYSKDLQIYLERSLWEFSEVEQVCLYGKMNKLINAKDLKTIPQKEWELYIITRIKEVFENQASSGIEHLVELLNQRKKRIKLSPLLQWEAKFYERLGEFKKVEIIYQQYIKAKKTPPVKVLLAKATQYELNLDFKKALEIIIKFPLNEIKLLDDLIVWSITFLRLAKREESNSNWFLTLFGFGAKKQFSKSVVFEILQEIEITFDKIGKKQNPFLEESNWQTNVKNTIPSAYAAWTTYKKPDFLDAFKSGSNFEKYLRQFYNKFLIGKKYKKMVELVEQKFLISTQPLEAQKEMGLFMDNRFKLFLEEVAAPGAFQLITHDFICFIEQAYDGNLELIKEGLFPEEFTIAPPIENPKKNSKKKKSIFPIDFGLNKKQEEPNNIELRRTEIKKLIASNKINEAFKMVKNLAEETGDENLTNQIIMTESRFNRLRRNELNGTLSYSDIEQERSRILMTMLNILDDL